VKNAIIGPLVIIMSAAFGLTACSNLMYRTGQETIAVVDELQMPDEDADIREDANKQYLEIFSFWAGTGEEGGIKALIQLFKDKNPADYIVHTAARGGGDGDAKEVLNNRMSKGDIPSSYLLNVNTDQLMGRLQPLNGLFQSEGWLDKFPSDIIDAVSLNGMIYGVPVDIHRSNVLWYNKEIFKQYGLEPPTTIEQFLQVSAQLRSHECTPVIIDPTRGVLWWDILQSELGVEDYRKFVAGELEDANLKIDAVNRIALEIWPYSLQEKEAKNWQDSAKYFTDGHAAMLVAGDWVKGYMTNTLGKVPGIDFGWVPFPGTENSFFAVVDAFGMDREAKDPDSVKEWLKVVGSVEGQNAFNLQKGSIPARSDADMSQYDAYSQEANRDFNRSLSDRTLIISPFFNSGKQGN